jgi:putative DNA-invertase from lambdoid prophage Rac
MSRVFAYCRVSTAEQVTANQRQEIEAAGFTLERHRIIEEYSGPRKSDSGLSFFVTS